MKFSSVAIEPWKKKSFASALYISLEVEGCAGALGSLL